MSAAKPDILECLRLTRLLRRIFGTLDPDLLDPDERRAMTAAAFDLQLSTNEFALKVPHV